MKPTSLNFKNGFMNVLSPTGGYIFTVESVKSEDSETARNFIKMVDNFHTKFPEKQKIEKIWHEIVLTIMKYGDSIQWMITSSVKLYKEMDWVSYSNHGDETDIDFAFAIFDSTINRKPENGEDIYIFTQQSPDDISEEDFAVKENLKYQAALKNWLQNDVKV